MTIQKNSEVHVKLLGCEFNIKGMNKNTALLLAAAVLILAMGIAYSFIRGYSKIEKAVEEGAKAVEAEIIEDSRDETE